VIQLILNFVPVKERLPEKQCDVMMLFALGGRGYSITDGCFSKAGFHSPEMQSMKPDFWAELPDGIDGLDCEPSTHVADRLLF